MLSFVIIYQSQRSITFPHTGGVNRKQFEDGAPPRNGGDSFSKPTQFYVEMLRNSSTLTFQTILSKSSVLLSTPQIPGLLV